MQFFNRKQLALWDTALSTSEELAKGLSRRQFGLAAAAALFSVVAMMLGMV